MMNTRWSFLWELWLETLATEAKLFVLYFVDQMAYTDYAAGSG